MTSLLSPLFSFLLPSLSLHSSLLSPSSVSVLPLPCKPICLLFGFALFSNLRYPFLSFYVLYLHTLLLTLWGPTVPLNFTSPSFLVYALPLFLFLSVLVFSPLPHTQFNFHFLCRSLLLAFQHSGETVCSSIWSHRSMDDSWLPKKPQSEWWKRCRVQRNKRNNGAEGERSHVGEHRIRPNVKTLIRFLKKKWLSMTVNVWMMIKGHLTAAGGCGIFHWQQKIHLQLIL